MYKKFLLLWGGTGGRRGESCLLLKDAFLVSSFFSFFILSLSPDPPGHGAISVNKVLNKKQKKCVCVTVLESLAGKTG